MHGRKSKETMKKHTRYDLAQMQSLPLEAKVKMTERRIQEWYEAWDGQVYVSFSGGKDSTVLLHIARQSYPDIEAVFVDTGLEFPSVRKFAMLQENVIVLRPKMNFRDVVFKYGYPIIGKQFCKKIAECRRGSKVALRNFIGEMKGSMFDYSRYRFVLKAPFNVSEKCCDEMKKKPLRSIPKKPIIGSMAKESSNRLKSWMQNGCNAFEADHPKSNPMSFWTENDVLTYLHEKKLPIAGAYGEIAVKDDGISGQENLWDIWNDYRGCRFTTTGCKRTGCIFCLFGIRQDPERILHLQKKEPKLADYVLRGGEFYEDGMWKPDKAKKGLGYWFILDWMALHGIKIPYENAGHYRQTYGNERTEGFLSIQKAGANNQKD